MPASSIQDNFREPRPQRRRIAISAPRGKSIPRRWIRQAAMHILKDHQFRDADISIAVVDDPTIHQLNRQWLGHDWPTDVLSFPLTVDPRNGRLDGEIVASLDTAVRTAPRLGWSAEAELTLYVIHGMLHLVGFDDHSPDQRRAMRGAERKYLARVGIKPPRKVAAVSRRHRPGGGA